MPYVTVIGAAHVDIIAKSYAPIKAKDSNPGRISRSPGGVGRNIAENLARLGVAVKLIAAVGDDDSGKELFTHLQAVGIDISHCYTDKAAPTSMYIATLDANGEMYVGLMGDSSKLTMAHIAACTPVIAGAEIVFLDANLDAQMNAQIMAQFRGKNLYVDTISETKAMRIQPFLGCFHTIKMNRQEAARLAGFAIADDKSLEEAGDYFLKQGTKRVIISLGNQGLYYKTQALARGIKRDVRPVTVKNATGAGDSLMAAVVYCSLNGKDDDYTIDFAQEMARITLMSETTVSEEISIHAIERQMKGE